jgi:hypothetical protein
MDEPSHRVTGYQPQQPQDYQYYSNCPQHMILLLDCSFLSLYRITCRLKPSVATVWSSLLSAESQLRAPSLPERKIDGGNYQYRQSGRSRSLVEVERVGNRQKYPVGNVNGKGRTQHNE